MGITIRPTQPSAPSGVAPRNAWGFFCSQRGALTRSYPLAPSRTRDRHWLGRSHADGMV